MFKDLPVILLKGLVLLPFQEVKLDLNNELSKEIIALSSKKYKNEILIVCPKDFIEEIESTCGRKIIHSIVDAEPIGPKKMVDVMIVCPCTGNTLAKLANSITDTAVTMAVKSHLRNSGPVVLALATNDALSGSAKNIGKLMNYKNIYFVPMKQDDPEKKPTSVIADFNYVLPAAIASLEGKQLQPTFL